MAQKQYKCFLITGLLGLSLGFSLLTASAIAQNVQIQTEFSSAEPPDMTKDLTPLQKYVTQHDGTETPFDNEYWDNHEDGIYVDIVSGEPLFSSIDKFDSGTGWPSFTKPIDDNALISKTDKKLWLPRTEVRSSSADSHLGHVFEDGPEDKGGLRYCINSASLRFIPKDKLEEEGYGEYLSLFDQ